MKYPKIETLFVRDEQTFKVTDELRHPEFGLIKTWHVTEKIDGTNIRIGLQPLAPIISIQGRTDAAEIPPFLRSELEKMFDVEKVADAFDLGTNYHADFLGREIRLAFLIRNIGGNMAFSGNGLKISVKPEDLYPGNDIARQDREAVRRATRFKLPTSFHIGLAYTIHTSDLHNWLAAVEFSQNNNMPTSYSLGSELSRKIGKNATAAMRAGWEFRGDELDLSGTERLRGLSAGGGIAYDFIAFKGSIDYAYRNWGRLKSSHLFSLSIAF